MKNILSFILIFSLLFSQQAAYGAFVPSGLEATLKEQVNVARQDSAAQLRARVFSLADDSRASLHSESWLSKLDHPGRPDLLEQTKREIRRYSLSAKKPRYSAFGLRYLGTVVDAESGETSGIYPAEMLGPSVPMARAIEQLVFTAPTERTLLALEVLLRKPDLHELPFLYTLFGAAAIVSPANASKNLRRLSPEQLAVLRENISRELAFVYSYSKRLGPVDLEYDRQLRNQAAQLLWGLDERNKTEYPLLQEPKNSIAFWEKKDEITSKMGAGMLLLSLLSLGRVRVSAARVPGGVPKMSIKAGTGTVKPVSYERGPLTFKPASAANALSTRVPAPAATPRAAHVYEGGAALKLDVREVPAPAPMKVLRPQTQPVQAVPAAAPQQVPSFIQLFKLSVPWLSGGLELLQIQSKREQPAPLGVPAVVRPFILPVPWFGDGLTPYVGEFLSAGNYLNREQLLHKIRRGEAVATDVGRTVGLGEGERYDLLKKLAADAPKNTPQYGPVALAAKPVQNAAAKPTVDEKQGQSDEKAKEKTEKESVRMLTGEEVLAELVPEWERELRAKLLWEGKANQVMDAVREAFRQSDAFIFSRAEDGTVGANPKSGGEWNYEQRFTGELVRLAEEKNLPVITKNLKQIAGGKGSKGWTFGRLLKLLSLEGFIAVRGVYPTSTFSVSGIPTPTDELTPEQQSERFLASGVLNSINFGQKTDPVIQKMVEFKEYGRQRIAQKSPEEYLRLLKEWMAKPGAQYPREGFSKNGQFVLAEKLSQDQRTERNLATGINWAIARAQENGTENTPVIRELIALKEAGRRIAVAKTSDEYLRLLKEWMAKPGAQYPRKVFYEEGQKISSGNLSRQQLAERNLSQGIDWAIARAQENGAENTPVIRELIALKDAGRQIAASRSPEEYLRLIKEWMAQPGAEYPREAFYENGQKIPAAKMTEEQLKERNLTVGVKRVIAQANKSGTQNTPVIQELIAYKEAGRRIAAPKSPEDYLRLIKEWMAKPGAQYPRARVCENGEIIRAEKLTQEQLVELNLVKGIRHAITRAKKDGTENTPVIRELIAYNEAGRRNEASKSPEDYLRLIKEWMAKPGAQYPRTSVCENGQIICAEKLTQEQRTELNLSRGINWAIARARENGTENTPVIKELTAYREAGRQNTPAKSPLEWQQLLMQHLKDFQQYPLPSSTLYHRVYQFLHRSKRGADGMYQNPDVQKLYELDQLARAAKMGEVAWAEITGNSVVVGKKKRLRISERDAQLRLSRQLIRFFEHATEEEKAALSHVAQTADELRDGFAAWQQQMQADNLIITANNTVRALDQLQKEIEQYQNDARADELDDLLGYLMRGTHLGRQPDGSYNRLVFRGERPNAPKLDDFHVVREVSGLDNSLARNAFKAKYSFIRLLGDEERVTTVALEPGVSADQLQKALSSLLPKGFHIRFGTHELGLSGLLLEDKIKFLKGQLHVHFEKSFAKEAEREEDDEVEDVSLVVNIDASKLVQNQSPKAVGKVYQDLFGPFIDEKTRDILRSVR